MMRYFYLILSSLAFSLTVPAASVSLDLEQLLEQKSAHYQELHTYYANLLGHVRSKNDKLFCKYVRDSVGLLANIFEDDQVLIKTLRTSSDPDYLDYAVHIEENSYSPLFSSGAQIQLCDQGQRSEILSLGESLQYHVINIDYLSSTNLLFWQSIHHITK